MTNCCDSPAKPSRLNCPDCSAVSLSVGYQTLIHQLKHPNNAALPNKAYYFCGSRSCNVVYFDAAAKVFGVDDLRVEVGQKSDSDNRLVCYCFDVSYACIQDELRTSGVCQSKARVMEWTRAKLCSCESRNPSGACCLAEFKRIEKAFEA